VEAISPNTHRFFGDVDDFRFSLNKWAGEIQKQPKVFDRETHKK
jgi:hypothetical protein